MGECAIKDLFNNYCKANNPSEKIKDSIINNIKNAIMDHSLDSLINNITQKSGEDITIKDNNIVYQITSSDNQNKNKNNNISTINLRECEDILKKEYEINDNNSILIYKVDYYEEGSLTPIILYEMYHPMTKEKLDLNFCENIKISISIPASINEDELFKYNSSSEFYSDICFAYTSDNGTDVPLNDRQNEFIENNLTLCQNDCKYSYYDNKTKKAICECDTKTTFPLLSEIKIDKDNLRKNFIDIKNLININIIKCYKQLFTREGIINNIGSYIILAIIILFFLSLTIYFTKDYFYLLIKEIIKSKRKNIPHGIKETEKGEEINKPIKINKKNIKKNKEFEEQIRKIINDNENYDNNSSIKNQNNSNPPKKTIKTRKSKKRFSAAIQMYNMEGLSSDASKSKSKVDLKNNDYAISNEQANNQDNNIENIDIYNNKSKNKDNVVILKEQSINIYYNSDNNKYNKESEILKHNDYELNTLDYEEALIYDKRTYSEYYCALLKLKHLFFFSFCSSNDYNSPMVKLCLFFFSFALFYTINALFYNDSTFHNIYEEKGKYNFNYQLPKIIYSTIISSVINTFIKLLCLSYKDIIELKKAKITDDFNLEEKKVIRCLNIRFIWFFNISNLFLIFFWYYLSCFCVIYKNTQYHLIKDTLLSFSLSLVYPLIIYILPGLLRIPSLKNNNEKTKYNISKYLQMI